MSATKPYPVDFNSIIPDQVWMLHALKQDNFIGQFLQGLMIIGLKLHLKEQY